ncbi:MAG: 50S ribosomal protein L32 [Candidatus Magasanikbacteria bacterium CG10_big_fil_rev_8_21_14_0_10_47_10]|uniref:Large ribosomal subunit protein bL32 n=1 Tax=Candidatus Magasanikbacteria bacterium CG10_big_fil_rev_8_21_14_0_10_47_10 TaxID=1974652 RepID=A0A2H0TRM6_9BACT|nr:MAG: 50S ribosomal protein L32 [Candidatus Magasanikbacteria bacterium CG10_big_fil_rev_8_21_14_0_10_47_10]
MGLPSKQRTSRSRDERRAHHALKPQTMNTCDTCKKTKRPHHACTHCGSYKGKKVVAVEKRLDRSRRNNHVS